jgi:hypothetical protein
MLRVHLYLFLLYDLYYYSPVPVRGAVVHTTYGKKKVYIGSLSMFICIHLL